MHPSRSVIVLLLAIMFNPAGGLLAGELPAASPGRVELSVTEVITGIDSQLKPGQWARITDEESWQRVSASHAGAMDARDHGEFPGIDFATSMVIALVEQPARHTAGIQVDNVAIDDEIVFLDFSWISDPAGKKKRKAGNVFGFIVLPRTAAELVLRRAVPAKEGAASYREVARFPALGAPLQSPVARPAIAGRSPRLPALNIGFGDDPGNGKHDGVLGAPHDLWNLVSMGTTAKDTLRYADTTVSPVRLRVTNHDGAWGVKGHVGIFHGYIYHNCQCVDLEATLLDLPAGRYRALVYAHGDAPDQNAKIELVVGDRSLAQKSTANDGTWQFRSTEFTAGVHYVSFEFKVPAGKPVKFISHRDGSGYSMFNAIQIEAITGE